MQLTRDRVRNQPPVQLRSRVTCWQEWAEGRGVRSRVMPGQVVAGNGDGQLVRIHTGALACQVVLKAG